MPTQTERERLRLDLGFAKDDILSLPDVTIDDVFAEAGERYEDPASATVATRVISLRRLLIQAANEVDYTQNNTSEKASQRYDHLNRELSRWISFLNDAVAEESGAARSGKPSSNPPRVREYPYGWRW